MAILRMSSFGARPDEELERFLSFDRVATFQYPGGLT